MAKYKSYDRGQGYFVNLIPSEQFDEYSMEMTIDRFVEENVSEDMFNHKYSNNEVGQKAIHPFLKLKVIFFSFSRGIQSAREMERMLKSGHIGYIFLSANTNMDHSTLSLFINDFRDEISKIYSKLLMVLNEFGLIDWSSFMIDGTKVSSFADKEFTSNAKGFSKKLEHYRGLSEKIVERSNRLDQEEKLHKITEKKADQERKRIERQKNKYDSIINKIEEYETLVADGIIDGNERTNLTDKESRLLKDKDRYIQGYNVQAVYSENDIIVDVEAVSQSNDIKQLETRIENTEGLKERLGVTANSKYLADKGYCNPQQITDLMDSDKDVYCAIPDTFKKSWINDEKYSVSFENGLVYFKCAGGIKKKGYLDKKEKAYIFIIQQKQCKDCKYRKICWEGRKDSQKKRKFKVSSVLIDQKQSWNTFSAKMESDEGRHIYNKRIGKEHNFYDLKENNGLYRIYRRGREKSNTIVLLAAIAYNLKKLSKYTELGKDKKVYCPT